MICGLFSISWLIFAAGSGTITSALPNNKIYDDSSSLSPHPSHQTFIDTPPPSAALVAAHQELASIQRNSSLISRSGGIAHDGRAYTFTTDFHVMLEDDDEERIDTRRIELQIHKLNEAFRDANISFKHNATFYHTNYRWANDDDEKGMLQTRTGNLSTLNIFLVDRVGLDIGFSLGTVGGKTTLPHIKVDSHGWDKVEFIKQDYVIVRKDNLVRSNWTEVSGNTVIHEVGHWFGLLHTFNVMGGEKDCTGRGDLVDDTPAHMEPSLLGIFPWFAFQCRERDTCPDQPGSDPVDNFMNYSKDQCRTKFTPGQMKRVRQLIPMFRLKA